MTKVSFFVQKCLTSTFLLLLVGLTACSQSSTTTPTQTQSTGPIKIGASIALSGDFSGDGPLLKQGYQLWQDDINKRGGLLGRQVQFDFLNDDSTKAQATTNYQKMISVDHDDLVVGPFAGEMTVASALVARRYNYALIEGSGTEKFVFDQHLKNLFSVSLPAVGYLKSFAEYLLALPQNERPKTVAYASSDDIFTQPQVDTAKAILDQGGIKSVLYDIYPAEATDFNPIAAKVINSHADVVILGTLGTDDTIAYMKAFKQQHYNPSAIIAASGPDQGSQFTGPLGGASKAEGIFVPNGGWYPEIKTYQNDTFVKEYNAKFGGTPDDISSDAVQAYSVGQVLEQAVNKIHSVDNTKLIPELRADTFNTLQGAVKFGDDGENTVAVAYLFQWQAGHLDVVYPSNAAQENPEYPKKPWS
jgi:branched-chain amino acid transport system substrate-binding protein